MIAFNEWFDNIEKEYPMFQDKDGYNIGNTKALRVGWKAALEWVLGATQCSGDKADVFWDEISERYASVGCDVQDTIRGELEE